MRYSKLDQTVQKIRSNLEVRDLLVNCLAFIGKLVRIRKWPPLALHKFGKNMNDASNRGDFLSVHSGQSRRIKFHQFFVN